MLSLPLPRQPPSPLEDAANNREFLPFSLPPVVQRHPDDFEGSSFPPIAAGGQWRCQRRHLSASGKKS